jgi:hypothetical protein
VQIHGSHSKEAAITKDDNLRPYGQSLPPSPPGPGGELVPYGTGHFCNSTLPSCMSIRTWQQRPVGVRRPRMPCVTWGWAKKAHPSISQHNALGRDADA